MNRFKVGNKVTFWDGDTGKILQDNGDEVVIEYTHIGYNGIPFPGTRTIAFLKTQLNNRGGFIVHPPKPIVIIKQ